MSLPDVDFMALTHAWLAALYRASWQGAIAVGLVWCLCRWTSRIPPSVRCWLWRLVLVKFLLVALWPGSIDLAWLPRQQISQAFAPARNHDSPVGVSTPGGRSHAVNPPPVAASKYQSITFRSMLWGAWMSGVIAVAAILFARAGVARRWRKRCTLVKDAEILTLCETLAGELNVYQPPVLFFSDACDSPVVFGALRTSVVLPAKLADPTDLKRLRLILRHELAHIRRGDLLWNWVATAVWGLFFFHPLVWVALRELRLNQELACDACAVAPRDASPADYGTLLVELADQTRAPPNMLVTVGVVESFEFLKRRLEAMKELQDHPRWTQPLSVSILFLATIGLLPWRLVAQAPAVNSGRPSAAPVAKTSDVVNAASRPALASTAAGEFKVAVENMRWAGENGFRLVESGFPSDAGFSTDGVDRPGRVRSTLDGPVLVMDLRVSGPPDDRTQLFCAVIGEAGAEDDCGNVLGAPDLPAHLKMEMGNLSYPQGSGYAAIHLTVKDPDARSIRTLTGELLVTPLRVMTILFEADELNKVSIRRMNGAIIQLDPVRIADQGIDVNIGFSVFGGGGPVENTRDYGTMHHRLRVTLEDSEGRIHEAQSGSYGGGGGAYASSSNEGGVNREVRGGSYAMSQNMQFPPLPRNVTVKRIICSIAEPADQTQRIAFAFNDLPLPYAEESRTPQEKEIRSHE